MKKRTIEVLGKKVEDAIEEGLRILHATKDEVDVKIISIGGLFKKAKIEMSIGEDEPEVEVKESTVTNEIPKAAPQKTQQPKAEPKKQQPQCAEKDGLRSQKPVQAQRPPRAEQPKFEPKNNTSSDSAAKPQFSKGTKPQRNFEERAPSAPVKPEYIERVNSFLNGLLQRMGIEGSVEVKEDDGMQISIETADSAVIGHRGEVLDALQYLCSLTINEMGGRNVHISLDAMGYRQKRIDTLKRLAEKTAQKCITMNRKVSLEPMSSAERRIVHAALSGNESVFTRSEGHEPSRRIVVLPVRK